MKYTAIIFAALSATAVQAVAVADPWCLFRGEGCWKAKRDAAPAAAADPWCLFRGEGCWKQKMKREAAPVAAPAPQPEANPSPEAWCLFRGEGCWRVKRAANAFAHALRDADAIQTSQAAEVSNMHGGAAYNAKRAIQDIGSLLAGHMNMDMDMDMDTHTDSPAEFFTKLAILHHFHPDSSLPIPTAANNSNYNSTTTSSSSSDTVITRRHNAEEEEEEEESDDDDNDNTNTRRWCLFRGEGCWKRDAAPWCLFRGEGCWKRSVPMDAREAKADPWCLFRGEGCWKRTDEGGSSTSNNSNNNNNNNIALEARDAAAAPAFCPLAGAAAHTCYASPRAFAVADKRACNQPGEACDVARRAAEALLDDTTEREESSVHVFNNNKKNKRDSSSSINVEARWCLFRGEGCWKRDHMDEVVARCEAEGGACHRAKRDLAAVHTAARTLLAYLNEEEE